jgi:hypothetical protein
MTAAMALQALNKELRSVQPYPGLRPFEREESRYFKGRDAQIEEIIQRLASDSCVVVLGGSGCGKSSIVRAGVIPALQLKMLPGRGDFWRVAICSPGRAPVTNLVDALDRLLAPDCAGERRKKILNVLYGSDGLGGFLPAFKKAISLGPDLSEEILDKVNLLVLIDQFEELFREENRGKAEAATLVGLITDAWRRRTRYPGFYLVLTMRTDDLHRCAEFIDLPEFINASSYLTRRLKETELRQAIVEPLRPAMFRAEILKAVCPVDTVDVRPYDVQVITELLDAVEEIAHDPDHLPLLQHLLAILWRTTLERWQREATVCLEMTEPQITLQDLARALGFESWDRVVEARKAAYRSGIGGWLLRYCLEYVAEQLYTGSIYNKHLTDRQRNIARVAFCLMGEVDDHGNFKRRWTSREEIASVAGLEIPDADVEAVIHRFHKDHCLLWVRPSGEIDVSHESLMRNWPRLGRKLKKDRDAGAAYRFLVERYAGWQQVRHRQLWPSWLMQWFGLLPVHELDRVKRLLAPRYNLYWSVRFISLNTNPHRDLATTGTQRSKALLCDGSTFRACRKYLWRSMIRNTATKVMKYMLGIAIVMVLGYVGIMYGQTQRAKLQVQTAFMWGNFGTWIPVMHDIQVESLWKLATNTEQYRSIFVNQLEMIGNIQQLAFRPHPVLRAVGLRWPQQNRQIGLKAMLEIAGKSQYEWDFAALACVVGALDNRIDTTSKDQALEVLKKYVGEQSASQEISVGKLWPLTRMIACVGDMLDKEVRDNVIQAIKKTIASAEPSASSFYIAIPNSTAMIASYLNEHASKIPVAPEELKQVRSKAIDYAIKGLSGDPSGPMAQLMARPLASLMAALSHEEQRAGLDKLLSFVNTRNVVDEDLLLSLAQVVESLAVAKSRVFSNGKQLEEWLEEDQNRQRLLNLARSADDTVAALAVARLIAPLAEHQPMPTDVVNRLLHIAGVEGSAINITAATDALLQVLQQTAESIGAGSSDRLKAQFTVADRLRLGLRGRLLAMFVSQEYTGEAGLAAVVVKATEATALRQSPSRFALEGLARALAALAPKLQAAERKQALQTAQVQLSKTGSAIEAAAWSHVIAEILKATLKIERDEREFVEQIIGVLKYPNAALIDREPGVSEPRSATDILVEALREGLPHLELPDAKQRWDGGLHPVLDKILKSFPDISLTTPVDPPKAWTRPEK